MNAGNQIEFLIIYMHFLWREKIFGKLQSNDNESVICIKDTSSHLQIDLHKSVMKIDSGEVYTGQAA